LSIVPVIAMLFGIAKGFGFETLLEQLLLEQAPEQDQFIEKLLRARNNLSIWRRIFIRVQGVETGA
jgi:membrane protein